MRAPSQPLVYATFFLALLCQLFPWAGQGIIFRPDFMLVALLYWLLRAPHLCNIGTAWAVGLLLDLATGSLLGQHALALTLTAFIALSFQRRLVLFSPMQVVMYVLSLLIFARATIMILKLFSGHEAPNLHYFWPVITGVFLWLLMRSVFGAIATPKAPRGN